MANTIAERNEGQYGRLSSFLFIIYFFVSGRRIRWVQNRVYKVPKTDNDP